MKIRSSPGKPSRLDTGPPDPINVEPAGWRPGETNRRHRLGQTGLGNKPYLHCDRQVQGLVAIAGALSSAAWNRIRRACAKEEIL
jgi:hypothetical protein